jgi:rhodanese-related sulfurtransferase
MSVFFLNCDKQQEIKTITTLELKILLVKEKIQLLDVRTPEEIKNGSIKTAMFIDYYDAGFYTKASQQLDKNKSVYLYCKSGNRSGKASKILQEKGDKVYNVLGGYTKWKTEN